MDQGHSRLWQRCSRLGLAGLLGVLMMAVALGGLRGAGQLYADPIPPPEGYPKLSLSAKTVTPTLAGTGGETLYYTIEIRNTGAYMAEDTNFIDPIPANTTYNGDAQASSGPPPTFANGELTWTGDVGFDDTVVIDFSVDVISGFVGLVENTAVISQALIAEPVTVTAEATIVDTPILTITKAAEPAVPGAERPLTYTLEVTNWGQPAISLPLTVTDQVPADTTLLSVGADGEPGPGNNSIIWTRTTDLGFGETSVFTFSVEVNDVPSGTIVANDAYDVTATGLPLVAGDAHTTTVLAPIFELSKDVWPDPPGANRELTYTLTLLNRGSMATDIVVTDEVPAGVTYVSGGSYANGVVTWNWPQLDTGEVATFTFVVYVGDVAAVPVVNSDYEACSAEGVCQAGEVLSSTIGPPTFLATAALDPIAKKPGGGGGPVTPTLTLENVGPGNALDAEARLLFDRISVQGSDLVVTPAVGSLIAGPGCGEHCVSFVWTGDVAMGEVLSFTTIEGQNTIGGEEGTHYTATIIVTDSLTTLSTTVPVSATAVGTVTHLANLVPTKSAPAVIGRGLLMTYTFSVWNSALSTEEPPFPWLTDTVPPSVTLEQINNGGTSYQSGGQTVVSWTLPHMSPGAIESRSYVVRVDDDLISGTKIVNDDYRASWWEIEDGAVFSNTGPPVTTTVEEVGLIDSFKLVTPALALPGPDNALTFYLHVANSGPTSLQDVEVYDFLPWEHSTYQRDAVASAGQIISDIVSFEWYVDVDAFSEEVVTLTVAVDPYYEGPITNTAVIDHPSLLEPVVVYAVAYITDDPVLRITKRASPDPVPSESELEYTIWVQNLGQLATGLIITDTVPTYTTYVPGSATGNGQLVGNTVRWTSTALSSFERRSYTFRVLVGRPEFVVNAYYGVISAEGAFDLGEPVTTTVTIRGGIAYMPVVRRE